MISHPDYYEQKEIWKKVKLDPYQKQVLVDILDLIPSQIDSILDVGCGSGVITNELPEEIAVFGLDSSFEALSQVQRSKCMGSITSIPFPDNSFDLVMTSDVLEHLNDQELGYALIELQRVAKKFVLVTVPLNEQIETNFVKCAECGHIYHVNYHQRSFSEKSILNLFVDTLMPVEIRLSGSLTRPYSDPTVALRHSFESFFSWPGAICSKCKSKSQVLSDSSDLFHKTLAMMQGEHWSSMLDSNIRFNDRSEIIALFTKTKENCLQVESVKNPEIVTSNRCIVEFSNFLQYAADGFTAQNMMASFTLEDSSCLGEQGVYCRKDDSGLRIHLKTPFKVQAGDRVLIKLNSLGEGDVSFYQVDSVFNEQFCVVSQVVDSDETIIIGEVSRNVLPDEFGWAWDLYLEGELCVKSIEFQSNICDGEYPFIALHEGLNVFSQSRNDVKFSWGLYLDRCGSYPLPDVKAFCENALKAPSSIQGEMLVNALDIIYKKWDAIKKALSCELEKKEILRDASEESYRKLSENNHLVEFENSSLKTHLEQVESHLEQVESHLEQVESENASIKEQLQQAILQKNSLLGIKGSCKELLRSFRRTAKRILFGAPLSVSHVTFPSQWQELDPFPAPKQGNLPVLITSHMFPHPEQKGLGSFVYEQVKYLREHENIDARVLVGRPFWGHIYKHPVAALRWNWYFYKRNFVSSKWYEFDGVPVMYVPYRVLPRLFFWHGRTYMRSIAEKAIEIHKEFPFKLVHAHTSFLDGSACRLISKTLKVPFVITEHTGPFKQLTDHSVVRYFTQKALQCSDRIISVSKSQKNNVDNHVPANQLAKSLVIGNGVDVEIFTPGNKDFGERPIQLIYIGSMDENKNVALLVKAFARLKAKHADIRLTLVGDKRTSAYKIYLDSLIEDLHLSKCVKFVGQKSRKKCAHLLSQAHILVVPSRSETFGCVVIEAFACGKPVVATRCGGPESLVVQDFLGELCENDDVDDLVKCLEKVIERIDQFQPEQIRRYAVDNYSYGAITKELAGLYHELVAK